MVKRVAVIGAGPSGLSVLHALGPLVDKAQLEVRCFERQGAIGGMWLYDWRTGVDSNGDVIHGSMYRDMYSNGAKECIE